MRIILALFLSLNFLIFSSFSQEVDHLAETALLFQKRKGVFACKSINKQIADMETSHRDQLQQEIQLAIGRIEDLSQQAQSPETTVSLERLRQELIHLSELPEPEKKISKILRGLCKGFHSTHQSIGRAIKIANSAAFHFVTAPFQWLGQYTLARTSNRLDQEGLFKDEFLYHLLGPRKSIGGYVTLAALYQIPNILIGTNPIFYLTSASYYLEFITQFECRDPNPHDKKRISFCQRYRKLRESFARANRKAFQIGKRHQSRRDKRLARKRADISPRKFCRFSKKKQIRRAKNLLKRKLYFSEDERWSSVQLILPIHKTNCTKILLSYNPKDFPEVSIDDLQQQFKSEKSILEGIEIVYLPKDAYPINYYYSREELAKMPIEQQVCRDIESDYYHRKQIPKGPLLTTLLKSKTTPELLGKPVYTDLIVPTENLTPRETPQLRNIVFAMGPSEKSFEELDQMIEEGQALYKGIKKISKKLKRKYQYPKCIDFLKRNPDIDFDKIEKSLARVYELSNDPEVIKYRDYLSVKKFFKKRSRRLKMTWELHPSNDMFTLHQALKDPSVGNIVFVSHGKKSSFLVDHLGNELPKSFFNQISPGLQSLNFYSCYSKNVNEIYDIQAKLTERLSYHKIVTMTHVKENDFFDSNSFAPVAAFGQYLRKVDRHLYSLKRGNELAYEKYPYLYTNQSEPNHCKLDISDMRVLKGTYAFELNNEYIGGKDSTNKSIEIEFPCQYLKEGKNVLRVKNVSNRGGSKIENLKTFLLEIEGFTLTPEHSRLRLNSTIKFKF